MVVDPQGPTSDSYLVVRGGGWFVWSDWDVNAWYCRSAYRYAFGPEYRNDDLGFRAVLAPGQ